MSHFTLLILHSPVLQGWRSAQEEEWLRCSLEELVWTLSSCSILWISFLSQSLHIGAWLESIYTSPPSLIMFSSCMTPIPSISTRFLNCQFLILSFFHSMPFYYEAKIVILSIIMICIAIVFLIKLVPFMNSLEKRPHLLHQCQFHDETGWQVRHHLHHSVFPFLAKRISRLVNWVYLFFIANYITISDRTTLEKIRKNNTNLKNDIQSKEKEE